MHRAATYEELGLLEHSYRDQEHILEADPGFIERYEGKIR